MGEYSGIDLDPILATYNTERVKLKRRRPSHNVWRLRHGWEEIETKDNFWARLWCNLFHWSFVADFGSGCGRCGTCDRIL